MQQGVVDSANKCCSDLIFWYIQECPSGGRITVKDSQRLSRVVSTTTFPFFWVNLQYLYEKYSIFVEIGQADNTPTAQPSGVCLS